jgi:A/G-specific adenine glycosylase
VRSLSVREAATPWEVLVVEVMSQQTQIERVGLAWRRFVDTSPSPVTLAGASTRDLLAAWAGLGYNRRALALREAARRIVSDHAGDVPDNVVDLEALPGIGPYTARAIAATAFGVPVAPLDVNVKRVMSRVTGIDPGSRDLQTTADTLVDRREPRRWLNAVMDLASSVCTRMMPRCDACPVFGMCASRGAAPADEARRPLLPFPKTTRWLRGRLIASLTDAPADAWVPLPDMLGTHDRAAIMAAAKGLEREGFLVLLDGHARMRP